MAAVVTRLASTQLAPVADARRDLTQHFPASGWVEHDPEDLFADSVAVLTERERHVVTLASTGMTNREIAAELYVSQKAVEYHLGNVFGKLGISSRRQLRGVLSAAVPGVVDDGNRHGREMAYAVPVLSNP